MFVDDDVEDDIRSGTNDTVLCRKWSGQREIRFRQRSLLMARFGSQLRCTLQTRPRIGIHHCRNCRGIIHSLAPPPPVLLMMHEVNWHHLNWAWNHAAMLGVNQKCRNVDICYAEVIQSTVYSDWCIILHTTVCKHTRILRRCATATWYTFQHVRGNYRYCKQSFENAAKYIDEWFRTVLQCACIFYSLTALPGPLYSFHTYAVQMAVHAVLQPKIYRENREEPYVLTAIKTSTFRKTIMSV